MPGSSLKAALKRWVPTGLWQVLRRAWDAMRTPEWRMAPGGSMKPAAAAGAWDRPELARQLAERVRAYDLALQAGVGLGLNPDDPSLGPNAFSASLAQAYIQAMQAAAAGKDRLSILDWGGGPGAAYALAKHALPQTALDYTCQELPSVCAAGATLYPEARFLSEPDRCFAQRYDLVLAGSSLWYAQDWQGTAAKLARATQKGLLIAKTGFVQQAPAFAALQRPNVPGYDHEFPCWILNVGELSAILKDEGLHLTRRFDAEQPLPVRGAPEPVRLLTLLFEREPA